MKSDALRLESAPPLGLIFPYFFTAPLFLILAGAAVGFAEPGLSSWTPQFVALTHALTIGFLMMVMFGAYFQLAPVVSGAPFPCPWLTRLCHALLTAGALLFVSGGLSSTGEELSLGARIVSVAVLLFLIPALVAMSRSRVHSVTALGMRFSLLALFLLAGLGLLMSLGYGGGPWVENRAMTIQLHLSLALICWVGGLLTAVSFQVVPMFYLAKEFRGEGPWFILAGIVLSLVFLPAMLILPLVVEAKVMLALAALPGAAAIWLLHPWVIRRALSKRRRRRPDATLEFWKASMGTAPLCLLLALPAVFADDARFAMAFGWWTVFGWAGLVVHGMLHRIVPFLLWLHWLSHLVGRGRLPTTRQLLPDGTTRWGLRLHLLTLVLGVAALIFPSRWLAISAGLGLTLVGLSMLYAFVGAVRRAHRAKTTLAQSPPRDSAHAHAHGA